MYLSSFWSPMHTYWLHLFKTQIDVLILGVFISLLIRPYFLCPNENGHLLCSILHTNRPHMSHTSASSMCHISNSKASNKNFGSKNNFLPFLYFCGHSVCNNDSSNNSNKSNSNNNNSNKNKNPQSTFFFYSEKKI